MNIEFNGEMYTLGEVLPEETQLSLTGSDTPYKHSFTNPSEDDLHRLREWVSEEHQESVARYLGMMGL